MARPLRIEFAGALYHVTSRGDGRDDIYLDDQDRRRFLDILSVVRERFNWVVHAYCLMSNHYHLLVETPDSNLSHGMRQLNGVFTQLFNRHHARVGHVFQGRYKAILVEKDSYLLASQKRLVARPLDYYEQISRSRDESIIKAYESGGYSMKEIGEYYKIHYSRVSRIVKAKGKT